MPLLLVIKNFAGRQLIGRFFRRSRHNGLSRTNQGIRSQTHRGGT